MALTFSIKAGDFGTNTAGGIKETFWGKKMTHLCMPNGTIFGTENVEAEKIELVEIASQENIKKLGGTVGMAAAGALLLGPLGLLAGLLVGGQSKKTTFICKLKDGRAFLAEADNTMFAKIYAAYFDNKNK